MRLAFGTETKRPPSLESRHADAFAKSSASLLRARRHQPPESNFIAAFGREGVEMAMDTQNIGYGFGSIFIHMSLLMGINIYPTGS
jgi:hypothetical protein